MSPNPPSKRVALPRAAWRFAPCKYPHFSKNILNPPRNEILDTPLDFNKLLVAMFGKIQHENKYVDIFGDFNINTMPNILGNASTREFKDIFASNNCLPLITKPTRVTQKCASLIDNIYRNVPINTNSCHSGILEVSISDYYAIFVADNLTRIKFNSS